MSNEAVLFCFSNTKFRIQNLHVRPYFHVQHSLFKLLYICENYLGEAVGLYALSINIELYQWHQGTMESRYQVSSQISSSVGRCGARTLDPLL
jgi:hypothetical protein